MGSKTVQDILYLQATTTSPTSEVVGMRIIENGEISDGPTIRTTGPTRPSSRPCATAGGSSNSPSWP